MSAKLNRLYRPDEYERRASDFYPTPPWVTRCLLDTVALRGVVWEPCAGQGAMAKVIVERGFQVVATDLSWMDDAVFPVVSGVDALHSRLPPGVQPISHAGPTVLGRGGWGGPARSVAPRQN
jgi:hypothetical protein